MPLIACKKCGAIVSDEFSYCTNCNAPLSGTRKEPRRSGEKEESTIPVRRGLRKPRPSTTSRPNLAEWLSTPLEADRKPSKPSRESCPNCGARITRGTKYCATCGQALTINIGDVLKSTFRIIGKAPLIFFPLFLELLFSSLLGFWIITPFLEQIRSVTRPSLALAMFWSALLRFLLGIALGILVRPLIVGMYPSMVKDTLGGKRIDMARALRKAVNKYFSILVSNMLVGFLTALGILLLVVPGLIVSTWYYYSDSAIILEDRGALSGMSASKAFARNKKWDTFVMLLVSGGISFLGTLIRRGVPILAPNGLAPFLAISVIFGTIAGVLRAVMSSYTYLSYAMRRAS